MQPAFIDYLQKMTEAARMQTWTSCFSATAIATLSDCPSITRIYTFELLSLWMYSSFALMSISSCTSFTKWKCWLGFFIPDRIAVLIACSMLSPSKHRVFKERRRHLLLLPVAIHTAMPARSNDSIVIGVSSRSWSSMQEIPRNSMSCSKVAEADSRRPRWWRLEVFVLVR